MDFVYGVIYALYAFIGVCQMDQALRLPHPAGRWLTR